MSAAGWFLDGFEVVERDREVDPDNADGALAMLKCRRCGDAATGHIDQGDTMRALKELADFHWYDCAKRDDEPEPDA